MSKYRLKHHTPEHTLQLPVGAAIRVPSGKRNAVGQPTWVEFSGGYWLVVTGGKLYVYTNEQFLEYFDPTDDEVEETDAAVVVMAARVPRHQVRYPEAESPEWMTPPPPPPVGIERRSPPDAYPPAPPRRNGGS